MNDTPAARAAAVAALARVLGTPAEQLRPLLDIPAPDTDRFRKQVLSRIFGLTEEAGMTAVVAAARVVPAPIAARVATRNNSPVMTAHIAALLEPSRAAAVAARLNPSYLSEVAGYLDLERSAAVIAGLPAALAADVARELAARQDWPTLAALIEVTTEAQLRRCVRELNTDALATTIAALHDPDAAARVRALIPQPAGTGVDTDSAIDSDG